MNHHTMKALNCCMASPQQHKSKLCSNVLQFMTEV